MRLAVQRCVWRSRGAFGGSTLDLAWTYKSKLSRLPILIELRKESARHRKVKDKRAYPGMGLRAAGGMKGAVPKAPNHVFGSQNGAKIIKNRGPGAFQQQTGSEEVPEAKKDPTL